MWVLKLKNNKEIYLEDIGALQLKLTALRREGDDGFIFKIKTNQIQNSTCLFTASIIGTLLSVYDGEGSGPKKAVQVLRARLKKFMYTRSRSDKKKSLLAIKYSAMAWKEMISHFAKQKLEMEVVSTIIRLYSLYAPQLSKYANINEKQIEALARGAENNVAEETEKNSYEMADFLLNELSKFTGIKPKKLNLLAKVQASAA